MTYIKPEVAPLGSAVDAVQSTLKNFPIADSQGTVGPGPAYEADE